MNCGKFIEQERKKQGISRYALAKKAGVTSQAILYWERGKRKISLENAEKICKALGISITIGAEEQG